MQLIAILNGGSKVHSTEEAESIQETCILVLRPWQHDCSLRHLRPANLRVLPRIAEMSTLALRPRFTESVPNGILLLQRANNSID
jgi:hypothetical protein